MSSDLRERLGTALAGRYRIERELGQGGMATVWLALDLKHDRRVAIKVLKPELAAVVGGERFLAEIRTTANLQHPNILPLFDSGEADGFLFYVMPYVEGESLRDRLERERQLPVEEAVAMATRVAEALDYAHGRGVVHRDVKPANILLGSRGEPLVADFGIALAVSQAGGGRITETGLSMGTPHYMSPEQASGDREVDPRSDIFALGCVLYESLAGQPPFAAATAQAVLARILTGEAASVRDARPSVPTHVDAAVARALERIPADRFRSAADFAGALAEPGFRHRATGSDATAETGGGSPWNRLAVALAFLVTVLAGAAAWGWLRPGAATEPAVATRAVVTGLGPGVLGRRLAISPDGRWIAATDLDQGVPRLKVRSAGDPRWRVLPETDGAGDPTFSPDGTWIAYETLANEIMRVPVEGGPPQPVIWGNNPHWAANDSIVFRIDPGGEVHMVGPAGGDPRVLLRNDTVDAFYPHLLPDGRGLLFSTRTDGDAGNGRVLVLDLASGEIREVARSGNDPRYVATGHVVFGSGDQTLMAVPFDARALRATDSPVPVLPGVAVYASGTTQYDVSATGTLVYDGGSAAGGADLQLVEVALDGSETPLPVTGSEIRIPRYDPRGRRIAYERQTPTGTNLRIFNRASGADVQLTSDGGGVPVWSPDGGMLYYTADGSLAGYRRPADAGEVATRLYELNDANWIMDVAADQEGVIVWALDEASRGDFFLLRRDGDAWDVQPWLATDAREAHASLSTDGRWVAYVSDESGEARVYVNTFPELSGARAVSPGYGVDPVWSADGRTLVYRSGTRFLAVDVTTEPDFTASAPRQLLERPNFLSRSGDIFRNWDLHPDGTRFLMVDVAGRSGGPTPEIYVVTGWFEEMRERLER